MPKSVASTLPLIAPTTSPTLISTSTPIPLLAPPPSFPLIQPPYQRITHQDDIVYPLVEAIEHRNLKQALAVFKDIILYHPEGSHVIRTESLHGLMSLLAAERPQRREHYGPMLEVIGILKRRGTRHVREWEWNALMDCSAKGFRTVSGEDYRSAIEVLEMWEESLKEQGGTSERMMKNGKLVKFGPSITTYNILVSIAAQTGNEKLLQDALQRLHQSSFSPDRITYLSQITYQRRSRNLRDIPGLVQSLIRSGFRIETDGANALIWAYAYHDDMETARAMYDRLIRNASRTPKTAIDHPTSLQHQWTRRDPILSIPSVTRDLRYTLPDFITHIIMLQSYAYRGDLPQAIAILQRFLSSLPTDPQARLSIDQKTMTAFRALFIGFVRHAVPVCGGRFAGVTLKEATQLLVSGNIPSYPEESASPNAYSLEALTYIFRSYIALSSTLSSPTLPPTQFVRALLLAFQMTSGDQETVVDVWKTLLRERLVRSGEEWKKAKETWTWVRMRRDFGLPEEGTGRGEDDDG